ncbi:MAG: DUF3352 domain-containing protein [Solirubrobacteraceae bacterium]
MLLKSRLSLLLAVAVLPLAGCGGDSSSGSGDAGADPAAIVPAAAPLYLEAVVRPDGDLKDGANDALKKLLRTDDPGAKIEGLIEKAAEGSDVSWKEVKEWLGPRVGVYVTEFSENSAVGALIADTTDADKAKATLDKAVKESNGKAVSAIVGDYAVIGTAEGVKAVQDAAKDGAKTLADAPDFQAARDAASGDDSLGLAYVAPQGLLGVLEKMSSAGGADNPFSNPQTLDVMRQLFTKAGRAAAVTLHADGDAVRVEGASIGASASNGAEAAASALAALPADAWLAVGLGDIGQSLTDAIAQFGQLANMAGSDGPDFSKLLDGVEKRLGIRIREDFLSWMGDGVIYARGHSIADIGGALSIKTKNPAKSRRAVGILAQALAKAGANARPAKVDGYDVAVELRSSQAPISLFIAANDDRFTLGVNPQAMTDLLQPAEKLGDSDTYDKAVDTLGEGIKPFVLIDTPTIISLIESFGADDSAEYAKVKPYLDALGPISIGSARDGDVSRFAFALGLR